MTDEPPFGQPPAREAFEPSVPVSAAGLKSLRGLFGALDAERAALAGTLAETLALADDFKRDAVRGLAERGATEAQQERYLAAYRAQTEALEARLERLRERIAELHRALDAL